MLFGAYPIIFQEIHGLNAGQSGCAFISIMVGCILSIPLSLAFASGYMRRVKANNGVHLPEFRLPQGTVGGIIFALSMLWLGWGGYKSSVSIWVPISSGVFTGIGAVLLFRAFQQYIIDLYRRYAASALGESLILTRSNCSKRDSGSSCISLCIWWCIAYLCSKNVQSYGRTMGLHFPSAANVFPRSCSSSLHAIRPCSKSSFQICDWR